MKTIRVPKELAHHDDLVVIPREEYEAMLRKQKVIPVVDLTPAEKRILEQSRKEMVRGEYVTLEELEHELGTTRRQKR